MSHIATVAVEASTAPGVFETLIPGTTKSQCMCRGKYSGASWAKTFSVNLRRRTSCSASSGINGVVASTIVRDRFESLGQEVDKGLIEASCDLRKSC